MNSRQRIAAALRHEEPDRVPFDLSSTPVTGIHVRAYEGLRRALGLPQQAPAIYHMMQQLAIVGEDVHEALDTDARGSRPLPPTSWKLQVWREDGYEYFTDDWGITRCRQLDGGQYFDLCHSPLAAAASPRDIERYPFPEPDEEARFALLPQQAQVVRDSGRAFVLGGICAGMMEMGQWLRGYEPFFCDLAADRALAEALCDKITELKMRYWDRALDLVGHQVDVIQEGDDYGAQRGLQVAPPVWREVFKPRLRQLFDFIHQRAPGVPVFFHSCGAIRDIIPDLIEVGVDALNPVQVAAAGMDSRELKRDFGDALSFWGGGVDTQRVLPLGSPQEVRDEVRRRIDDLAPGGGFVFAAVHNIQGDVPPENILAMRQALAEYGAYA